MSNISDAIFTLGTICFVLCPSTLELYSRSPFQVDLGYNLSTDLGTVHFCSHLSNKLDFGVKCTGIWAQVPRVKAPLKLHSNNSS